MVFRFALFLLSFLMFVPQQLSAQGVFNVYGFPKAAIATGQTEVLGSVLLTMSNGSTLADSLVIDVSPLQITNTNATDIRVTVTGSVSVGAVTINATAGHVSVPVNAGATGGSLRVDGIRVALAGSNLSSVTAHLSWATSGNDLTSNSVVVVNQVTTGLVVDPMTDTFKIIGNTVYDSTGTIVIHEGFSGAFTNSTAFGQDTPTRIHIQVTDFPQGLTMQFPTTVTSSVTGATLTTVQGTIVNLPRTDGSTDVYYNFAGPISSSGVIQSFSIPFTVATSGPVQILQPTIEVSLAPIGAAVPTSALPATNVPRFAENDLVALAGSSLTITKTLYWSGIDNSQTNVLSIFNPASATTNLTLTALDASGQTIAGTNVVNPVQQSLSANQSSNQPLTTIFGSGATTISTVVVQSTGSGIVAMGTNSATGVSTSVGLVDGGLFGSVLPEFNSQAKFQFLNLQASAVSGTLTLRSGAGSVVATAPLTLSGLATSTSQSLQDLFGTSASGYLMTDFAGPIATFSSFGVAAQAPAAAPSLYVPFFVTGNGYETELDLINRATDTVTLSAQLMSNQGVPIGSATSITLASLQELTVAGSSLFQLQGFTTGYVRIDLPQLMRGPFYYYPAITGHAQIRLGQSASTVLRLSDYAQTDAYFLNSGAPASQYQGITVLNPTASSVTVTLQALSASGSVLGMATLNLSAGQLSSKLISEYFTASIPVGSVIRVSSSTPVVSTSITGSVNGDFLKSTSGLN